MARPPRSSAGDRGVPRARRLRGSCLVRLPTGPEGAGRRGMVQEDHRVDVVGPSGRSCPAVPLRHREPGQEVRTRERSAGLVFGGPGSPALRCAGRRWAHRWTMSQVRDEVRHRPPRAGGHGGVRARRGRVLGERRDTGPSVEVREVGSVVGLVVAGTVAGAVSGAGPVVGAGMVEVEAGEVFGTRTGMGVVGVLSEDMCWTLSRGGDGSEPRVPSFVRSLPARVRVRVRVSCPAVRPAAPAPLRTARARRLRLSRGRSPGRLAPGIGTTTGALRQLPGQGDLLRAHPVGLRDLGERRRGARRAAPAWPIPPSGLHGRNAMPSSAHSSSSGSLERNAGENWFCTDTSRPPRISWPPAGSGRGRSSRSRPSGSCPRPAGRGSRRPTPRAASPGPGGGTGRARSPRRRGAAATPRTPA